MYNLMRADLNYAYGKHMLEKEERQQLEPTRIPEQSEKARTGKAQIHRSSDMLIEQ